MNNITVFSAYKDDAVIPTGNYVSGYNKIFANYGNSFDTSSGIFTVPKSGYFEFFAATYCNNGNNGNLCVYVCVDSEGGDPALVGGVDVPCVLQAVGRGWRVGVATCMLLEMETYSTT